MHTKIEKIELFPTIVYKENLYDKFSKEIQEIAQNEIMEKYGHHHFSVDRYILDSSRYIALKEYMEYCTTRYISEVLQIDGEAKITQSWINSNAPGESAHRHVHPNSFASGVLYLSVFGSNANITFHQPVHNSSNTTYTLVPKLLTREVASQNVDVSVGDLIIFPSYFPHSVSKNTTDKTRLSLAFNSLTKDTVGDYLTITEFRIA